MWGKIVRAPVGFKGIGNSRTRRRQRRLPPLLKGPKKRVNEKKRRGKKVTKPRGIPIGRDEGS